MANFQGKLPKQYRQQFRPAWLKTSVPLKDPVQVSWLEALKQLYNVT